MVISKVFETSYCQIFFDDVEEILHAKWMGFLKPEQVKTGCDAILNFVKKNGVRLYLSDHTDLTVLLNEVQDYLDNEWIPKIEKAGLGKMAVLVSQYAYSKITEKLVNREAWVGSLRINTFSSKNDCLNWLKG